MLIYNDYNGCEENADEDIQIMFVPNQIFGSFTYPFIFIKKRK